MTEAVPSGEGGPSSPPPEPVRAPPAAGTRFALVGGLVAVALIVASAVAFGFGRMPRSPEALYEKIAELNGAGRTAEMWDYMTDEARQAFKDAIDGQRDMFRRNPDPEQKLTRQYASSREEFMVLPYTELMRRENLGRERVFDGAKIADRLVDPRRPDLVTLVIEPPAGPLVHVVTQQVGSGWGLVRMYPVIR